MTDLATQQEAKAARLAVADKAIKAAEAEYAEALADLRSSCPHATLLEAPWEASQSGFFAPMEHLRICEDCGVEEERTTRVLSGRAYPVARNDLYRARKRGPRTMVSKDTPIRQ